MLGLQLLFPILSQYARSLILLFACCLPYVKFLIPHSNGQEELLMSACFFAANLSLELLCKQVDFEYVKAAAELAKQAGVPQFSLLTAQGAKANVWAPYASLFHGLLYMQTKGRAEEAVKAQVRFDLRTLSLVKKGQGTVHVKVLTDLNLFSATADSIQI